MPTPRPVPLAQGPSGRGPRFPGLGALAGLAAGSRPRCALVAFCLVRPALSCAACEDSGRCGALLRRHVLLRARIFESPVLMLCLLQLLRRRRLRCRAWARSRRVAQAPLCNLRSRALLSSGALLRRVEGSANPHFLRCRALHALLPALVRSGQPFGTCTTDFNRCVACGLESGAVRARAVLGGVFWRQN